MCSSESWQIFRNGFLISTEGLLCFIDQLKSARFKESTRATYYRIWKKFNEFFFKLDKKPDTLFVGHLIDQNRQSQTIKTYVSALKGVLAEVNIFLNEDQFLLSALTRACKYKNDMVKMRLPIRKAMLRECLRNHDLSAVSPLFGHFLFCRLLSVPPVGLCLHLTLL